MRAKRSREAWTKLVATYERSNLAVEVFCDRHDIAPNTFLWWRSRLRCSPERAPEAAVAPVRLLPVEVAPSLAVASATVEVIVVRVHDVELRIEGTPSVTYIAALVQELRTRC